MNASYRDANRCSSEGCEKRTDHFTGMCRPCRSKKDVKQNNGKFNIKRKIKYDTLGFAEEIRDGKNRVIKKVDHG